MTAERHSLYLLPASSQLACENDYPASFPVQIHIRNVVRDMPRQDPNKLHIVSWKLTAHSIQSIGQGKYSLATRSTISREKDRYTAEEEGSDNERQMGRSPSSSSGVYRMMSSMGSANERNGSDDGFYSPALSAADSTASDPLTNWTITPDQPEMESIITAQTFTNSARIPAAGRPAASPKLYDPFEIHSANSTLVSLAQFGPYFDDTLKSLGVFRKARRDFLAYWLPRFKTTPFVAVRFVQRCEYESEMPIYVTSDWPVTTHRILAVFRRVRLDEVPYWHAPSASRGPQKQARAPALSSGKSDTSSDHSESTQRDWRSVAALSDWTHDPGLTLVEVGGMDVGSRSVYFS